MRQMKPISAVILKHGSIFFFAKCNYLTVRPESFHTAVVLTYFHECIF